MAALICAFRVDTSVRGITIEQRVGSGAPSRPSCSPLSSPVIPDLDDAEALSTRVHSRLRPSARPLGLFAAQGRAHDRSKLAELAKADRQPALALTDTDNLFGALEFSDKLAGAGIQPIVGCELAVDFGDQDPSARKRAGAPARIVLLAESEPGYRSLMRLNSRAFLETPDRTRRRTSSSTRSKARPRA